MAETGWSVAIQRKDGTEFLCSSAEGVLPPVWPKPQRKQAVAHKRDLVAHGFKARVVAVEFMRPVVLDTQSTSMQGGNDA